MESTKTLNIVKAERKDVPVILDLIKQLAIYEKMLDDVTATEEMIEDSLFCENSNIECVVGWYNDKPVGFALYFYNYSTFLGKRGLYLEDLFVIPEMRGKGLGKALLTHLAKTAVENNCGRLEWSVLNWNEPAIKFYESLGALPMSEWTVYRLTGDELTKLAKKG